MGSSAGDPDAPKDEEGEADPERREPRSRGVVALIAGGIILVVVVVMIILYFTASETSDDSGSLGPAGPAVGVVIGPQ